MSCPCFSPRQPRTRASGPECALLPLGDAWTGLCLAQPADPVQPADPDLPLCNLGYARGACSRFPEQSPADAVRFTVARDYGASLQIYYVLEAGHLPHQHGELSYLRAGSAFQPDIPSGPFHDQARAYIASYLRRTGDPSAPE